MSPGSATDPVLPAWIHFLAQPFPSANVVLLAGRTAVLVDSGYGSDADALDERLAAHGVPPSTLALVLNTHWHSDHVGGNHHLQVRHRIPVAAARSDAASVNQRDPDACLAEWLDQPVEPYRVDEPLDPGDVVHAGEAAWQVLATPGHTPSHLSFYLPDEQVLLLGDALHADDVGWINVALEGPAAIDRALATTDVLARLPVRLALPGHGPAITEPAAAIDRARHRYERMRSDPARAAWHAMKRIFAYALMIHGGLPLDAVPGYLLQRAWLVDHAARILHVPPEKLVEDLMAEMRRARAVVERDGRLHAATPHRAPKPGWQSRPGRPRDWKADPAR